MNSKELTKTEPMYSECLLCFKSLNVKNIGSIEEWGQCDCGFRYLHLSNFGRLHFIRKVGSYDVRWMSYQSNYDDGIMTINSKIVIKISKKKYISLNLNKVKTYVVFS